MSLHRYDVIIGGRTEKQRKMPSTHVTPRQVVRHLTKRNADAPI